MENVSGGALKFPYKKGLKIFYSILIPDLLRLPVQPDHPLPKPPAGVLKVLNHPREGGPPAQPARGDGERKIINTNKFCGKAKVKLKYFPPVLVPLFVQPPGRGEDAQVHHAGIWIQIGSN